jgi:hypothetical protein
MRGRKRTLTRLIGEENRQESAITSATTPEKGSLFQTRGAFCKQIGAFG